MLEEPKVAHVVVVDDAKFVNMGVYELCQSRLNWSQLPLSISPRGPRPTNAGD